MKFIINNRDRLHTLQEMVAWGLAAGHEVVIVDQASSYPPLIEWFSEIPSGGYGSSANPQVLRKANVGPWPDVRTGLVEFAAGDEFAAYTDSDLDLSECPLDMLDLFATMLRSNSAIRKIGCALRLDDLPDAPVANHAWKREIDFWPGGFDQPIYRAKIASTLAVYRVGDVCRSTADLYGPALRVAGNCTARHRPWYYTEYNMPEDERYYLEHMERKGPVFSGILRKELSHAMA